MNIPEQTVNMKSPSCDITLPKFATPSIFAQITLLIPTGEIHIIAFTIFMMTLSMILKKSTTSWAFFPRDPRTVPNVRQKKMIPKVLVPDLKKDSFNQISKTSCTLPVTENLCQTLQF